MRASSSSSLHPEISHRAALTLSQRPSSPTRATPIGACENAVSNSSWASRCASSALRSSVTSWIVPNIILADPSGQAEA